ncbi:hypothetical protein LINPERHAP2_LOCUS809 [Linum perenne]
MVADHYVVSED